MTKFTLRSFFSLLGMPRVYFEATKVGGGVWHSPSLFVRFIYEDSETIWLLRRW